MADIYQSKKDSISIWSINSFFRMAVTNLIGEAHISLANKSSHKEVTNIFNLGIKALQVFGGERFLDQFQPESMQMLILKMCSWNLVIWFDLHQPIFQDLSWTHHVFLFLFEIKGKSNLAMDQSIQWKLFKMLLISPQNLPHLWIFPGKSCCFLYNCLFSVSASRRSFSHPLCAAFALTQADVEETWIYC